MVRKAAVIIFVLSLLLLNSCGGRTMIYDDDDQIAGARLEQAIEAIENHDKDSLRAMFSKQALDEAEDLDVRMVYLFEKVGEIIIDDLIEVSGQFLVFSVPTILIMHEGREILRESRFIDFNKISRILQLQD